MPGNAKIDRDGPIRCVDNPDSAAALQWIICDGRESSLCCCFHCVMAHCVPYESLKHQRSKDLIDATTQCMDVELCCPMRLCCSCWSQLEQPRPLDLDFLDTVRSYRDLTGGHLRASLLYHSNEILLLYFGLTADVNLDARKRASERVKQELEEQKQKGEVHIVRG